MSARPGPPGPAPAASSPVLQRPQGPRSLRWRLLALTLVSVGVAIALAWFALGRLFAEHVQRQFEMELTRQLDQLTARLDFDAGAAPRIDPASLSDPRWQRPLSGLYWQLDGIGADGKLLPALARSRSLWDVQLSLPVDQPADGQVHVHTVTGPQERPVLVLERTVRPVAGTTPSAGAVDASSAPGGADPGRVWRLAVAGDLGPARLASDEFSRVLGLSLAVLAALLAAAAWAQVAVGLRPLRTLRRSLHEVQAGRAGRLSGRFPGEVQPLVEGFNEVLARNQDMVEQARVQAGNLAHALKTPLAVLDQLASGAGSRGAGAAGDPGWADQVQAQVQAARRQVDWHLGRARMAAGRQPGQRCEVAPVLQGLMRTMARLYAGRDLAWQLAQPPALPDFAGQAPALQEMLGNLLDNAGKWARSQVRLEVRGIGDGPLQAADGAAAQLEITVEDDGPGIAPDRLSAVVDRGVRLDESVPGSGLGLAIVQDGARLHGGDLLLEASAALGGLRAVLRLPVAPASIPAGH